MVDTRDIRELIGKRLKATLTLAEGMLPPRKFKIFKKVLFEEFGRKGFERDLIRLLDDNGKSV